MARTQRLRTALRRGIKVRCRAAGKGRCRASASRSRKRLAYGTKAVRGGRTYTFYAKPNKAGRRLMRRALRRRARTRVSLRITLPGSGPVRRKVTLRP